MCGHRVHFGAWHLLFQFLDPLVEPVQHRRPMSREDSAQLGVKPPFLRGSGNKKWGVFFWGRQWLQIGFLPKVRSTADCYQMIRHLTYSDIICHEHFPILFHYNCRNPKKMVKKLFLLADFGGEAFAMDPR